METRMKCQECGNKMKIGRENYRHPALGLPNLTLVGVEVARCPNCGQTEVAIHNLDGLIAAVATVLVGKPGRLAPDEIRFLRKHLGWSGADLARRMGVSPEAVSRWEGAKKAMGPVADRLLRMLVASAKPVGEYSLDALAHIGDDPTPAKLRLRSTKHAWAKAA